MDWFVSDLAAEIEAVNIENLFFTLILITTATGIPVKFAITS